MSLISIKKLRKKDRHWDDIIKKWNIVDCEIIEAKFMDIPSGLIAYNKAIKRVKFIYVLDQFRNLGIGTLLLKQIEKKYNIEWSDSIDDEPLRSILSNLGWSKPEKEDRFFQISNKCLDNSFPKLDLKTYSIKKWSNEFIKDIPTNSPKELIPEDIDWAKNSLALFKDNKLLGWMLTKEHKTHSVIEYSKLFLSGNSIGLGSTLFFNAIDLHRETYPEYDGSFKIYINNTKTLNMIERYFKDYIVKKSIIYHSSFN